MTRHARLAVAALAFVLVFVGSALAARYHLGVVTNACCTVASKSSATTAVPFTITSKYMTVYCDNTVAYRLCTTSACTAAATDFPVLAVTPTDIDSEYSSNILAFLSTGTDAGFNCQVYNRAPTKPVPN